MSEHFRAAWDQLPALLASHLLLSVAALAIAVAVSVPGGIALARQPRLRNPALAFAGAVQTIPSLALLALMVPFLAWSDGLGIGIPALGFAPALAALTLYGILPILANTVRGILGVDRDVTNAARAVGMTARQQLLSVELPLALPVILAGVRTSAVWIVGTATLATPVGQPCLGTYIFTGLQTSNETFVLFGVAGAAAVALGFDFALGSIERAVTDRSRRRATLTASLFAAVLTLGLLWPTFGAEPTRTPGAGETGDVSVPVDGGRAGRPGTPERPIRIGAKTFTEQYILAQLLEQTLEANGLFAERVEGLGSSILFDALVAGEIDLTIDYSGTLWANSLKRTGAAEPWRVNAILGEWLAERNVQLLGSLGFENAYAIAVRAEDADARGLFTLADLVGPAPEWRIGGDYEFFGRPEWKAIVDAYGVQFSEERTFDPTLMYSAIEAKQVDAISAYSSDGRIATYDLRVLADPKRALPPYDALLLLGPEIAGDPTIVAALAPLIDAIDLRLMQEANAWVDREEDALTVPAAAEKLGERIRR